MLCQKICFVSFIFHYIFIVHKNFCHDNFQKYILSETGFLCLFVKELGDVSLKCIIIFSTHSTIFGCLISLLRKLLGNYIAEYSNKFQLYIKLYILFILSYLILHKMSLLIFLRKLIYVYSNQHAQNISYNNVFKK